MVSFAFLPKINQLTIKLVEKRRLRSIQSFYIYIYIYRTWCSIKHVYCIIKIASIIYECHNSQAGSALNSS